MNGSFELIAIAMCSIAWLALLVATGFSVLVLDAGLIALLLLPAKGRSQPPDGRHHLHR